jgi:hypothetical protein
VGEASSTDGERIEAVVRGARRPLGAGALLGAVNSGGKTAKTSLTAAHLWQSGRLNLDGRVRPGHPLAWLGNTPVD